MQAHPALVLNADFRPLSYFPLSVGTQPGSPARLAAGLSRAAFLHAIAGHTLLMVIANAFDGAPLCEMTTVDEVDLGIG